MIPQETKRTPQMQRTKSLQSLKKLHAGEKTQLLRTSASYQEATFHALSANCKWI